MLNYLDVVAKQTIVIRRHFWYTRDAINFLTHTQNQDNEIRYLQIAYDDIGQLIDLVEYHMEILLIQHEIYTWQISRYNLMIQCGS